MSRVCVFFHYPCPDGLFACLAAFLRYRYKSQINKPTTHTQSGVYDSPDEVLFIPHEVTASKEHLDQLLSKTQGSLTYFLDYSGAKDFIFRVCEVAHKVVLLDHHVTAEEDIKARKTLPDNLVTEIDMKRSGAMIAWDYFSREDKNDFGLDKKTIEQLYKKYEYIQDNDLWLHKLPNSKYFASGFSDLNLEFDCNKNPSIFETLIQLDIEETIQKGRDSQARRNQIIAQEIEKSFEIQISDGNQKYNGLALFTEYSDLRSIIGNELAIKGEALGHTPFGAVCYFVDDRVKVSLRSVPSFDTTPISSHYGGGGHKNASSFIVSKSVFELMKVTK